MIRMFLERVVGQLPDKRRNPKDPEEPVTNGFIFSVCEQPIHEIEDESWK